MTEHYIYTVLLSDARPETAPVDVNPLAGVAAAVQKKFRSRDNEIRRSLAEVVQKGGAGLRGNIAQFLSTPLKSDKEEIDTAVRETFETLARHMGVPHVYSDIEIDLYRVLDPQTVPLHRQLVGVIRRILKNGRALLVDAGMMTGKGTGKHYLISFRVDDFSLLPGLHSDLAAVLHDEMQDAVSMLSGSLLNVEQSSTETMPVSGHMVLIDFDADDETAERLRSRLSVVADQFGVHHIVLSKRMFVMGFGSERQLRFSVDINTHALGSIIMALTDDDEGLEDAITTRGSLMVLENGAEKK